MLVPANEATATSAELKKLGGDITTYEVSEEALQQAAEAARAQARKRSNFFTQTADLSSW